MEHSHGYPCGIRWLSEIEELLIPAWELARVSSILKIDLQLAISYLMPIALISNTPAQMPTHALGQITMTTVTLGGQRNLSTCGDY
jgi:hypothetical protein